MVVTNRKSTLLLLILAVTGMHSVSAMSFFTGTSNTSATADICKQYPNTASVQHYMLWKDSIDQYYADLLPLFNTIIPLEHQLNSQGYTTFFHAQRSKYLCYERWHTFLNKTSQAWPNNTNNDFLSFHIKPYEFRKQYSQKIQNAMNAVLNKFYQNEILKRKDILKKGRNHGGDTSTKLFYINACLFSNMKDFGSSSAHYYVNNSNTGESFHQSFQLSLEKTFIFNGFKNLYTKHKINLDNLENKYKKLFSKKTTGVIHLIAFPHNQVNKSVYLAKPYGYKKELYINGKTTEDVQLITQTYRTNINALSETDKNEFCLVMTEDPDGGLNPECGMKVYTFVNPAIQQEYEKLLKEEKKLMDLIAQDIKNNPMPEYEA